MSKSLAISLTLEQNILPSLFPLFYASVSKFVTSKWIELNYLSGGQYSVNKNIRFKTPMLRSDLCDYIDA